MLEIKGLVKRYGAKAAVDHLDLTCENGEIFGFIGPNGAGKTTTIKAVVGILDFDEGEIRIDGHSIRQEPLVCKQNLAYIPDNPDLYDIMRGDEYLNFVADIYQIDKETRIKRIQKYAALFELEGALAMPISSYSHGMKQKLALISAFLHEPKLLVLDEPFVGLDPKASFLLKKLMREHCDRGNTIFFSTHVLEVAQKLCDHVGILKDGRLAALGTMEEVTCNQSLEQVFLELADHE